MLKAFIISSFSVFFIVTRAQAQTSDFMPMVYVQGGTFEMGGNDDESHDAERPIHSVTLRGFWIGKYEVTVAQYRAYCNDTGASMPETPRWGWGDDHPIVNVNWSDAKEFADWLSEKTGQRYSLPTEAQWEYAARGGNRSQGKTYAGSNSLGIVGWFSTNSGSQAHAVGQKQANELGIYDMSGNVWEWCRDWYDSYSSQAQQDPRGPGSGTYRVLRGGSWYSDAQNCRVAFRNDSTPVNRNSNYGFRLVSQSQ